MKKNFKGDFPENHTGKSYMVGSNLFRFCKLVRQKKIHSKNIANTLTKKPKNIFESFTHSLTKNWKSTYTTNV